jgi:hypothetical protein
MLSKYRVGDTITVRLGGMDLEEIVIKGEVEEIRQGNPPSKYVPTGLPSDPCCYRLKGIDAFYRESSVIHAESYKPTLGCVPSPQPLPA